VGVWKSPQVKDVFMNKEWTAHQPYGDRCVVDCKLHSDADAAAYGGDELRAQGATVPPDLYSLTSPPP